MGGAGRKRIEVGTDAASPGSPTAILIVARESGGKKGATCGNRPRNSRRWGEKAQDTQY
jgi:hypothetical protein